MDQARIEVELNLLLLKMAEIQKSVDEGVEVLREEGSSGELEGIVDKVMREVDSWTDRCGSGRDAAHPPPEDAGPDGAAREDRAADRGPEAVKDGEGVGLIDVPLGPRPPEHGRGHRRSGARRDGVLGRDPMVLGGWEAAGAGGADPRGAGWKDNDPSCPRHGPQPLVLQRPRRPGDDRGSPLGHRPRRASGRGGGGRPPGQEDGEAAGQEAERAKLRRYSGPLSGPGGGKGVLLALENLEPAPWNLCSDPNEMGRFLDEFPRLGMTLDISHATPPPSGALAFVEALGDRILDVHVSATVDGVRHLPPSAGPSTWS